MVVIPPPQSHRHFLTGHCEYWRAKCLQSVGYNWVAGLLSGLQEAVQGTSLMPPPNCLLPSSSKEGIVAPAGRGQVYLSCAGLRIKATSSWDFGTPPPGSKRPLVQSGGGATWSLRRTRGVGKVSSLGGGSGPWLHLILLLFLPPPPSPSLPPLSLLLHLLLPDQGGSSWAGDCPTPCTWKAQQRTEIASVR